ncbi:glycoside hydrolase family 3 protein [Coniophora puteana RWD-64-598 SS2]|uniref:Glycoside hydrolase family 3 protein n=1 Tax=Coniophora puteana (strain RWD-64-598) TaxID=741705 RepID=A0A5M3MSF0_CONPW|nr:glycoside hydrolase family 3 protein [Coniophora puteana RWD-64-598 SS2]EIW81674.1 glycoside hydrolase family 3 protein [Coniophora puteana RWD-64-598 SS2]
MGATRRVTLLGAFILAATVSAGANVFGDLSVRDELHFPLYARATNNDGSTPTYKNANASIEDRINDLLPRMTVEEKVAQLMQGDIDGWMNMSDPLDDTLTYNATGLEEMLTTKAGAIWAGYLAPWDKIVYAIEVGQRYLMENTTLGIPGIVQSEGLHGFTDNGTTWPSPIGLAASFNAPLLQEAATTIATEAEGLGYSQLFAPVLDLSRELRWGRVEENYGEDPFLTSQMGRAYVEGIQTGRRRNVSDTATARVAATCKHYAAYGSPQGGLNIAPVHGGERDLRTYYLKPFEYACVDGGALSIMSAYASYDGVPLVANKFLLTDVLRNELNWTGYVTTDAGSVDLLITTHGVCPTRECAAKLVVENGLSMEMGGGTYTYLTLPDQISAGLVNISYVDEAVKTVLRTKFSLGLFENPYPYPDYAETLRTQATRDLLHQMEREAIILLENRNDLLPLGSNISSVALIGPQSDRVSLGDYVFYNASNNGISPLTGFQTYLASINSSVTLNFAEGCKLWSYSEDEFSYAVSAAQNSDVAVVMVGTWSLDQTLLWTPGTNATTGEGRDESDLALVGAQMELVQRIQATGTPTVVVFVSGKPVTEPWIQENVDAVIQQFYPGELGGLAIAEVIFGAANPSGRLPVSFPRNVGTAPAFYNYYKGGRPLNNPGMITENLTMVFGSQYVLDTPVPTWSFGHGLSYTTFNYTNLELSSNTIGTTDDFNVTVTVHNAGSRDGAEVVQVYMTDLFSSVVTPAMELIGFEKVNISSGTSQTVTIPVRSKQLAVWTVDRTWAVEPGNFSIWVGTSDTKYLNTTLTVE